MRLVDSHCHLDFDRFDKDREQVIAQAVRDGIEYIINPGIDLASSRAAIDLAEQFPQVYATVGIHPNDSADWHGDMLEEVRQLAQHPKVVAIGEIGLDYYRDHSPRFTQKKAFKLQLALAAELELPVIIHNREASEDVVKLLLEWQKQLVEIGSPLANRPGVLHSYSGNLAQARQVIAQNFCVGFTGPVTFKNAGELRSIASQVPLDYVLVETDAPFLTPAPFRGQRNEPRYVKHVAEKLAELHGRSSSELADITTDNAIRIFKLE
jgi:TatD DNase family protein